jgi:trehalose 6-phosphate phosphatase
VAVRPPLLVIADFDGTLSPGSRDPGAARIEPGARRALRRLAAIAAARPDRLHLAVLTGRTVADVAERTRVGGIDYLGDHGLQHGRLPRGSRGPVAVTPEAGFEGYAPHAEALAAGVTLELGSPSWLFVERKGPSVAFHVRQADDIPAARAAVLAAILAVEARDGLGDHGLEPYRGRSVVDLRPRDAGGKGEAAARLIATSGAGAAISFGDDLSDTDAFDSVIAARDERRLEVGLIVAVHGRVSTPPEILARADLVVASARDVGRMLAAIARRVEREGPTG